MSDRNWSTDLRRLGKKVKQTPTNALVTLGLIAGILAATVIVNSYIWTGKSNAVRSIIAQSLEAEATVGLLALGIFLIVYEILRRPPKTGDAPDYIR